MIRKLRGVLDTLGWTDAVVDAGGVGYQVFIPLSTRQALGAARPGSPVALWVHTRVREDGITLFGFATEAELRAFELLLQASGVGPRTALSALSTLEPDRLLEALARGDVEVLQRAPGIGRRTAERLCVELRQKARDLLGPGSDEVPEPAGTALGDGARHPGWRDAVEALVALGYSRQEAGRAVRAASRRVGAEEPLEALVKASLAVVAGGR